MPFASSSVVAPVWGPPRSPSSQRGPREMPPTALFLKPRLPRYPPSSGDSLPMVLFPTLPSVNLTPQMQTPWCCPRQVPTTWVNCRARCRDVRPPGEGPASAQGRQRQWGSQCHTGTVALAPTLAAANVQGTGTSIAGAPGAAIFSAGRMTGASVWPSQRRGAAEGGRSGALCAPLSLAFGDPSLILTPPPLGAWCHPVHLRLLNPGRQPLGSAACSAPPARPLHLTPERFSVAG